jgi:aminoglycoside phosphotransferase (APT) family kinase protein
VAELATAKAVTPTAEIWEELERALSAHFGAPSPIRHLRRRPCAYRSSFALEELGVELRDGSRLELMFKDLGQGGLSRGARRVKPFFLYDPLREIEAYCELLAPTAQGTATFYGAAVDHERRRYWLFVERVEGAGLWQFGEFETWERAARWLADFHARFAAETEWRRRAGHLIKYDPSYYRLWPRRAQAFRADATGPHGVSSSKLEWLAERHEQVVERLVALPTTFLHGEFYASNVLVDDARAARVCPIDWEIAAVGPGLIDLAALVAGKWSEPERRELALAYRSTLAELGGSPEPEEAFLAALDWCRLHLAVRWIGWAPSWSPPREHRHDWLGEALRLAEEVEL